MVTNENNLGDKKEMIELLVLEVKKGDHDAFSKLYDLFVDPLYRYIYFRVKSDDVEDILECVFMKIWENIDKYQSGKGSFSAWAFRIAHNMVIDHYRANKDKEFQELTPNLTEEKKDYNPHENARTVLNNETLKLALSKVKEKYRDIIVYKFINQLSNLEVAKLLNQSEGSVRILQFRALKALKNELESMGIHYDFLN